MKRFAVLALLLLACTSAQLDQRLATRSTAELTSIWERSLDRPPLSVSDCNRLKSLHGGAVKPAEGGNRESIAAAAAKAGSCERQWVVPLDDIEAHRGGWPAGWGVETFSPLYGGWWAGSMANSFDADARWWAAAKPWLIAHSLALGPVPSRIWLETHRGRSFRGFDWGWGGALYSIHPGPRFIWNDPLTASGLIQRAVSHPLASLAAGHPISVISWTHHSYGLPLNATLSRQNRRPTGWGEVLKNGRDAVAHLADLPPLSGGLWFRYYFADTWRAVAMSHGSTGTRGTAPLAIFRGGEVTYYSTAQQTGGGRWSQSRCADVGTRWEIRSSSGELAVEKPSAPDLVVLWDGRGARVETGEPVEPEPPLEANQQILAGMSLIDQGLVGYPEPRQKYARDCQHQTRRLADGVPVDIVAQSLRELAARMDP